MRGCRWEEKGRDEGVHILVAVLITLVEDLGGAEKACTDPAIDTKTEQGRDNGDPRNIGMTVAMDACPTACWHTLSVSAITWTGQHELLEDDLRTVIGTRDLSRSPHTPNMGQLMALHRPL